MYPWLLMLYVPLYKNNTSDFIVLPSSTVFLPDVQQTVRSPKVFIWVLCLLPPICRHPACLCNGVLNALCPACGTQIDTAGAV